ncbi:MAG TPA: dihydrodipicolinate reductase C-terminal domain-containing protein [Gemmatimonadales bacterium]
MPRVAIIGTGRMGRAVRQLADERGWPVVAGIGREGNEGGRAITAERLADADVAIEFTTPDAAPSNVRACLRAGIPVVTGTTGWLAEREAVEREAHEAGGALFVAPNFSLGVNLFWRVAERAAALASSLAQFDAAIIETHHAAKKDAPSGTALELQRRTEAALGRPVPTTSVRLGHVPGTHELLLDAPFEQLRVEHVARDRRVFAEGALLAAAWLARAVRDGRRGTFTMDDLLEETGAS